MGSLFSDKVARLQDHRRRLSRHRRGLRRSPSPRHPSPTITIGSCRHSDITVFSFHPVKLITTGEGGLATTNNPELAERMSRLRSHGITRDPAQMQDESNGSPARASADPWSYRQIEFG